MTTVLFLNLGAGEVFLVFLVILLFFGSKSIPSLARGLGKGMREFRDAAAGIQREIQNSVDDVKQSVDLSKEINELDDATRRMTGDVQEGLNSLNQNLDPEKNLGDADVFKNKQEQINQHPVSPEIKPETTVPENVSPETTENPSTENQQETTLNNSENPEEIKAPEGPPNTVIRKK